MTNEELEKFHRLAMDNSELALIALRNKELAKYRDLSSIAFTYEKKAALGLYKEKLEPSRSVLFRSAGYIALDNALFTEAQKLYELGIEGEMPEEIKEELEELKVEIDRIKTENESFIQVVSGLLQRRAKPWTGEMLDEDIRNAMGLFKEIDINILYVRAYLEMQMTIGSDRHITLEDETFVPWIHNKKGTVVRRFWERYVKYLRQEQEWAPDTLDRLDDITDDILDHLRDPAAGGDWDKRGMIVGQVQSGKTSNYTGLICKAADYGYKIIVVLAGMTNDLRAQTQLRTDMGFLGRDTKADRPDEEDRDFGVSRYDPQPQAHYLTTSATDGDFKTRSRRTAGTNPRAGHVIAVVKKNKTVLKQLIRWFAGWGEQLPDGKRLVKNLPLLVIDDEADNGSINISQDSISAINGLIRSLLSLFQQSAYVGYTATPFANVFIPIPEESNGIAKGLNVKPADFWLQGDRDLFPRNFIINIFPPTNYVGPSQIFGISADISADPQKAQPGLPLVIQLSPDQYQLFFPDKHKKDDEPPQDLPESLKKAIKSFILVCAVRRARGQIEVHNSMLVHVTRFVRWQNKTANLINGQLKFYQRQIQYRQGNLIEELRSIYLSEFLKVTDEIMQSGEPKDLYIYPVDWTEVEAHLYKASAKIQVRAIHGDTKQEGLEFNNITSLDYYTYRKTGLSVIAVGGNKLSRGLTLEGLSTTYYLRASKMYDTLMQMGRWFGYRPGYLDLCRLYTSEEIIKWYKYITVAAEELRAEFEEMKIRGKTPINFGIKVRQDPDVLSITATNKMRSSTEMELTYSDRLKETWCFKRDLFLINSNYRHTLSFIDDLGRPQEKNDQPYVWYDERNSDMVVRFLQGYTADSYLEHQKMTEYIQEQAKAGFLTNWTIAFISNKMKERDGLFYINHIETPVGLTMRADVTKGIGSLYEISGSHIIDPKHEYLDFNMKSLEFKDALDLTIDDWLKSQRKNKKPEKPIVPSGKNIRLKRPVTEGLLIIYPLHPQPDGWKDSPVTDPIIAYAISFPNNEKDKKLKYQVNQVFMEEFNEEDDGDEISIE